jgi:hypothetical protein
MECVGKLQETEDYYYLVEFAKLKSVIGIW